MVKRKSVSLLFWHATYTPLKLCCYFKLSSELQNFVNCDVLVTISPKVAMVLQSTFRCLFANCWGKLNFSTVYMFITSCWSVQHWHTSVRTKLERENSA